MALSHYSARRMHASALQDRLWSLIGDGEDGVFRGDEALFQFGQKMECGGFAFRMILCLGGEENSPVPAHGICFTDILDGGDGVGEIRIGGMNGHDQKIMGFKPCLIKRFADFLCIGKVVDPVLACQIGHQFLAGCDSGHIPPGTGDLSAFKAGGGGFHRSFHTVI